MKELIQYWHGKKTIQLLAGFFLFVIIFTTTFTRIQRQYNIQSEASDIVTFIAVSGIFISLLVAIVAIRLYKNLLLLGLKLDDVLKEKETVTMLSSSILNALPAHIALLDNTGVIIEVNDSWKSFADENGFTGNNYGIGSSYIDVAEKSCGEVEEDTTRIAPALKEMILGKIRNFSIVYPCHSSDKKRWFKAIATYTGERKSAGIVLMHLDITDQYHAEEKTKQSEAKLRKSEEELRALFTAMNDIVMVLDADGRCISIAPTSPSNKYKPSETWIGKKIPEALLSEDAGIIKEKINLALSGSHPVSFEYNLPTEYGRAWFEASVSPLTNNTVFWVARNITERKLAELEHTKITIDLIQRNKDLEQFAYIISHNLRAPVANIMGVTDILANIELDLKEEEQMMDALVISVKKLDNVIKDLNHILQVKREVSEKKEMVKFSEIINDVKLSMDGIICKEEVQLLCDFSETDEMATLKSYLYSVFFNLISNSIKYRQPNLKPLIEITSVRSGNKTELIFKDNGLGIDLERTSDQVFGLYKRFHFHTEGKGMGLFMVKTQVETLGGKISVCSEVNKGAEFKIEFEN